MTRVRCATRRDAIDYITSSTLAVSSHAYNCAVSARIQLNNAINDLDRAAIHQDVLNRIILQRLAVRLRPYLVEIDNLILKNLKK